eukprot:7057181-Pyramimonas_sp.AAC.1
MLREFLWLCAPVSLIGTPSGLFLAGRRSKSNPTSADIPIQNTADDRTGSSRGHRDQWSYDRSSDRWATQSRDDAWRYQNVRTGNDGILNRGTW